MPRTSFFNQILPLLQRYPGLKNVQPSRSTGDKPLYRHQSQVNQDEALTRYDRPRDNRFDLGRASRNEYNFDRRARAVGQKEKIPARRRFLRILHRPRHMWERNDSRVDTKSTVARKYLRGT